MNPSLFFRVHGCPFFGHHAMLIHLNGKWINFHLQVATRRGAGHFMSELISINGVLLLAGRAANQMLFLKPMFFQKGGHNDRTVFNAQQVHHVESPTPVAASHERPERMKRQARQIACQREGDPLGSRSCVPYLEGLVVAGGDDQGPVGAGRAGHDITGVSGEGGALGPRRRVPDLESLVPAGRNDQGSVGADGAGHDVTGVAGEGGALGPRGRIPDLEGLVLAGRNDKGPVRADSAGLDRTSVAGEGADKRFRFTERCSHPSPGPRARTAATLPLSGHPLCCRPLDPLQSIVQLLPEQIRIWR